MKRLVIGTVKSFGVIAILALLGLPAPANSGERKVSALATFDLHAKIYLVSSSRKIDPDAVSAWLLTMDSDAIFFSPNFLKTNLADNAEKFCSGGVWRAFHKKLESGYLEAGFVCLDGKAEVMRRAAIVQNLDVIDAAAILNR